MNFTDEKKMECVRHKVGAEGVFGKGGEGRYSWEVLAGGDSWSALFLLS